jgi:hypothetical protein
MLVLVGVACDRVIMACVAVLLAVKLASVNVILGAVEFGCIARVGAYCCFSL